MNNLAVKLRQPTAVILILANLIPLFGVLFWHWEVFPLMLLFWMENVILGIINVAKMITVKSGNPRENTSKAFIIPFFCLHYGMFTLVHGVFVIVLFSGLLDETGSGGDFSLPGFLVAILSITVSHLVSFYYNYIRGGEYTRTTLNSLMFQPYGRVIVLHLTIIGSGFLIMILGSPVWGLVLLIIAKIILDVKAHIREHAKLAIKEAPSNT